MSTFLSALPWGIASALVVLLCRTWYLIGVLRGREAERRGRR